MTRGGVTLHYTTLHYIRDLLDEKQLGIDCFNPSREPLQASPLVQGQLVYPVALLPDQCASRLNR